jgi:hypothetical protein
MSGAKNDEIRESHTGVGASMTTAVGRAILL